MSEYIHEIVLQEFIVENISALNLNIQYKNISRMKLVKARINQDGTFWDLEGLLENGIWIPIEVEWITHNFYAHKHHLDQNYHRFLNKYGILLVLRRSKETPQIQQLSILDNQTEAQFKQRFKKWFKSKSNEYIDKTLESFSVGSFKRDLPRIILYPLSQFASCNYFSDGTLYRKTPTSPAVIGFKETGYVNNSFIRDLRENDICLFVASDGTRCKRAQFIEKIRKQELPLSRICGYKIKRKILQKQDNTCDLDIFYWPDEIKSQKLIYPHFCLLDDSPFMEKTNLQFPFIQSYSEDTWKAFRSCIQYGEYREISPLEFALFISNL